MITHPKMFVLIGGARKWPECCNVTFIPETESGHDAAEVRVQRRINGITEPEAVAAYRVERSTGPRQWDIVDSDGTTRAMTLQAPT
jgi:hypothetical protein